MTLPARRTAALLVLIAIGACAPSFKLTDYPSPVGLYEASLAQYRKGHWENAVTGFESLTLDLPPRDSLLPLSHYYLGMAHERRGEDLLAAQSLVRLVETFPSDTLADDAIYEAARSYQRLWRKPELDPQYGLAAIQAYQTLLTAYPASPVVAKAQQQIAELNEWCAQKDYETGDYFYLVEPTIRRSSISRMSSRQYPDTPTAPEGAAAAGGDVPQDRLQRGAGRTSAGRCGEVPGGRRGEERLSRRADGGAAGQHRPCRPDVAAGGYARGPDALTPGSAMRSGSSAAASIRRTSGTCSPRVDAFEALELDRLLFVPAAVGSRSSRGRRGARRGAARHGPGDGGRATRDSPSTRSKSSGRDYLTRLTRSTRFAQRYRTAERFFLIGADALGPGSAVAGTGADRGAGAGSW